MPMIRKMAAAIFASLPMLALAHAGHDHSSGFWSGFIHPFTGLDHLMMAIAFGVLMWNAHQRWKILGLLVLAIAMGMGFLLGSQALVSTTVAEYGIVLSLAVLAISLWSKSNRILPAAAVLLASFHGVAHGTELGHSGQAWALILGMLLAISLIYVVGMGVGALVKKYVPHGQKIIGGFAAVVAVISLA